MVIICYNGGLTSKQLEQTWWLNGDLVGLLMESNTSWWPPKLCLKVLKPYIPINYGHIYHKLTYTTYTSSKPT